MPHLPRDIGEQIAGARSKRRRLIELIRRLFGLAPREGDDSQTRFPKPGRRDRV